MIAMRKLQDSVLVAMRTPLSTGLHGGGLYGGLPSSGQGLQGFEHVIEHFSNINAKWGDELHSLSGVAGEGLGGSVPLPMGGLQ